jgi:uncharacterized protein YcaQ
MKSNPTPTYPLSVVRTLALHAQGLTTPLGAERAPTTDVIYDMIEQLGCVQIDTLQMVQRSQYVVLWSRLGAYDPVDLDRVAYGDQQLNPQGLDRRLFEYWLHAACLIPLTQYRYRLPIMQWHQTGDKWFHGWSGKPENVELMKSVLKRIQHEGPLRAVDFEHTREQRGTWWDWKPAKHALEQLFNQGRLMITNRVNFQRVYDLRERVLPDWVDTVEPTSEEMKRHLIERAIKALGAAEVGQVAGPALGYVYGLKRTETRDRASTCERRGCGRDSGQTQ